MTKQKFITVQTLATELGVCAQTVRTMATAGKIPGAMKVGAQGACSAWRFPVDAADRMLDAALAETQPATTATRPTVVANVYEIAPRTGRAAARAARRIGATA